MNHRELAAAVSLMSEAISYPRKVKSFMHACENYRRGARLPRRVFEELKDLTMEQLWEKAVELSQNERVRKE